MKLFIRFSLFTTFIVLLFIVYRSEIFHTGLRRDYYLPYFYISIFLVIFFIILLNVNKKFKEYCVIIFMSILFSLYCFESYLILKDSNFYKKVSVFNFYKDIKKKDPQIVMTIPPNHYRQKMDVVGGGANDIFSLSGISNVPTLACNENGYYSIYISDRYGFNNPDIEWNSREIEYFLVGDSFTHGACVNRPDDISSVLRNVSAKTVLNLGYGGNGPLIEYATLREYLTPNVKKVLWLYFEGNDLNDLDKELKNEILNKYLKNTNFSQNLKYKQDKVNKLGRSFLEEEVKRKETQSIILDNIIIKFIKLSNSRRILQYADPKFENAKLEELKIILNLANELVKKNNSQLFFIYLPSFQRYEMKNPDSLLKKNIEKIINNLNIPFIDIDNEVFKKENHLNMFASFDSHYNVTGYKKIALKIYEKTRKN